MSEMDITNKFFGIVIGYSLTDLPEQTTKGDGWSYIKHRTLEAQIRVRLDEDRKMVYAQDKAIPIGEENPLDPTPNVCRPIINSMVDKYPLGTKVEVTRSSKKKGGNYTWYMSKKLPEKA